MVRKICSVYDQSVWPIIDFFPQIMYEDGGAEFLDMSKEDWEICNF